MNRAKAGNTNEVRRLMGGKGPKLILEMLANVNLAANMDLAANGRIIVIGNR